MNEKFSEDQTFQDLFLALNHIDLSNPFNVLKDEKVFLLNLLKDDIVILVPQKQDIDSFQIIDLKRKKGLHDPFEEILVDYNQLSIKFYGKANRGERKLLISAVYNQDENLWDVRSHIKENDRPSTLDDALDELLLIEHGGLEQRESFISIINLCKELAKESTPQKKQDAKTKSLKN